jgi:uncharacterized protein YjdB
MQSKQVSLKQICGQRVLTWILSAMLICGVFSWDIPQAAAANGTISANGTYDISAYGDNSTVTINSGLSVTLMSTSGISYHEMQIICGERVALTIDGIEVSNTSNGAAVISFTGSNNRLILAGMSMLQSDDDMPGIKVEAGTSLEITGDGSLHVRGKGGGAGIGAGSGKTYGNIEITGGYIEAASNSGAGIGGGAGGGGGTIRISGGYVSPNGGGGMYGAGIGGGKNGAAGSITISGGTVLGSGGDEGGAGIGGGYGGNGGTILISADNVPAAYAASGYINVCVIGGKGAAGIGGGYGGAAGSITISGGFIDAEKGNTAPYDVGSGLNGTGGSLSLSGSGVLFLGNGACITPTNSTHTLKTTPKIPDNEAGAYKAYGFYLPDGGSATAYVYIDESKLYGLTYDANGGSGAVPEAATQYKGTTITVAEGSALSKNGEAFGNWSTTDTRSGNDYAAGEKYTFTSNTILYAIYGELIPVSSVTLSSEEETMAVGDTLALTATVLPEDASYPNVTWSSSNDSIATVNQNGLVTAVSGGNATITAAAQDGSGACDTLNITVTGFSGKGTEASPYLIANKTHLNEVRNHLSSYFRLENDIVLTAADFAEGGEFYNGGAGFVPIGTSAAPFTGELEGGSHRIKGLYQNITDDAVIYGGLFGFMQNAVVKNLGMEEGDFTLAVNGTADTYIGGFAGYADSSIFENCSFSGNVSAGNSAYGVYAGGIAGNVSLDSIVSGCSNTGDIAINTIGYAGGITGKAYNGTTVSDCQNAGDVTGNGHMSGGIAGFVSKNGTVSNCRNTGGIATNGNYTGGIAGYVSNMSNINLCTNSGEINGKNDTGGITGCVTASTVLNCTNNGAVGGMGSIDGYKGGITGYAVSNGVVRNCFNTGTVNGTDYTGGIAGHIYDGKVEKCYNTGSITATGNNAGGITGYVTNGGAVNDCYNTGDIVVAVNKNAGGIAGCLNSGALVRCYNTGNVSGSSSYVGGIAGARNFSAGLSWCYFLDRISMGVGSGQDTSAAVTVSQLGQQAVFIGFDFAENWTMDGNSTYAFPELQSIPMPGTYVTGITVSSSSDTVVKAEKLQLSTTVFPSDADDKSVVWTVENGTGEATVSKDGLLTGIKAGTVIAKASSNDGSLVFGSKEITVAPRLVSGIAVTCESDTVVRLGTIQLSAVVQPADADVKSVIWSVVNGTGEATVNASGLLTGTKAGTVTVKATANDGSGAIGIKEITVIPIMVSGFTITSPANSVVKNQTLQMNIISIVPDNAEDKSITWSIQNGTGEATIDESGLLTGIKEGTVTVKATANDGGGANSTKTITVMLDVIPVGIHVSKTNVTSYRGSNGSITITASGGSGSYQYSVNGGSGWQETGYFGGLKAGTYSVAARDASDTDNVATASVTLGQPAYVQVVISASKKDVTLYGSANGSIAITARGGNSGLYQFSVNGGVSWQSRGSFSGLAAGTYTVAARDSNNTSNKAMAKVTVKQPRLAGTYAANKMPSKANTGTAFHLNPPAPPKGYKIASASFSSSKSSVAAVDGKGNVTFLAVGKATITTKVIAQTRDKNGKVKTKTTTVKKTVTVQQLIAKISLNATNVSVMKTKKVRLIPTVTPTTASNKKVKWTSSNSKVAFVSSSGEVTGKTSGKAVIKCTALDGSGVVATCTVTVTPI